MAPESKAIQQAAQKRAVAAAKPTLKDAVNKMLPAIAAALPKTMTPERFSRVVLTALSANPKLMDCTQPSFLGSMMIAAQLGLEVNTPLGHAYLIPFRNHGIMECTFQLGYKGLIDLAYRSGQISTIQAQTVYANDTFEYELGLDAKLIHKPALSDRGDPVAFYALYKTKDGGWGFEVMSLEDIRQHARRFSKSADSGPWATNFEAMAKKTVLKRVLKYAPLSTEVARMIAQDETVHREVPTSTADLNQMFDTAEYVITESEPEAGEPMEDVSHEEGTTASTTTA